MQSAKLVTGMLLFLPVGAIVALVIFLIGLALGFADTRVLLAVVTIVAFFWITGYTDQVHDRNLPEIKERAYQICVDPEKGANWARRQLLVVGAKQLALVIVVAVLGRAAVVAFTGEPFVTI